MQLESEPFLEGYNDIEKGAYLGALASLATADRNATEEETEHIRELAQTAGLSRQQEAAVVRAATELSGEELTRCLEILKQSNLKFPLVTDLIAFAEADNNYTEDEKIVIKKIADYLDVNTDQFSLLDNFVHKASTRTQQAEDLGKPGFIDSLGFNDSFAKAGINAGAIGKGLIGFLGPMLLSGMAAREFSKRGKGMGGFLGRNSMRVPVGLGSLLHGFTRTRTNPNMSNWLGRLLN